MGVDAMLHRPFSRSAGVCALATGGEKEPFAMGRAYALRAGQWPPSKGSPLLMCLCEHARSASRRACVPDEGSESVSSRHPRRSQQEPAGGVGRAVAAAPAASCCHDNATVLLDGC
eukprot:scaffold1970_cov396-Prasinococcus_capsulatus_cf.AAC.2